MIIITSIETLLVLSNRRIYSNGLKQKLNFGSSPGDLTSLSISQLHSPWVGSILRQTVPSWSDNGCRSASLTAHTFVSRGGEAHACGQHSRSPAACSPCTVQATCPPPEPGQVVAGLGLGPALDGGHRVPLRPQRVRVGQG